MRLPGLCEGQHLFSMSVCKHLLKTCTATGKLFVLGPGPMVLSFGLELVFSVPRGRLRPLGFKQEARLVVCGLLSPCKTLRNFLLPPTAECGNPCCQATSAVTHSCSLGSSFHITAYFCTFSAFENVSDVVGWLTDFTCLLFAAMQCCS